MQSSTRFAAQLLETSADVIAGQAARDYIEKRESSDPVSIGPWTALLRQRLDELVAALLVEEPRVFTQQLAWERSAWLARGVEVEGLCRAHRSLEEALRNQLPPNAWPAVEPYLRAGVGVLESEASSESELDPALDPERPLGKMGLAYLQAVLEGDRRAAIDGLVEAFDGGTSIVDLYEQVLVPVQREMGEMWHRDEIMVSEEHFGTTTTQQAMAVLCHRATPKASNGLAVVATAVSGNPHSLGVRILTDLFELEGWRAVGLGAQVPIDDLLGAISAYRPDVLLISASLGGHLSNVQASIEVVRRQFSPEEVKVMVGGRAFDGLPDLWRAVGADGYGQTAQGAVEEAERLVGSSAS